MSRLKQTLSTLAAIAVLAGMSLTAGADEAARSFQFNIENQPLAQALRSFGHVAGQQIVFTNDLVKDVKAVSLQGEFTAEAALVRLLNGTGLAAKRVKSGVITIVRASNNDALEGGPADQMRMAMSEDKAGAKSQKDSDSADAGGNQVTVEGQRERGTPFVDGNLDLPRSRDDVQPYTVFDAETIERSGATNIDDFLKQRLTMNTVAQSPGKTPGFNGAGNTSLINLRGLGADKTLILVNGRRMAGIITSGSDIGQADLNGIPLSSIDRIEVLPSSASGIYGGSAIGGVINVVLKRDYAGGEVRATYDNSMQGESPRRTASASYGIGLEGGKTYLNVSANWSQVQALAMGDRVDILRRNLDAIQTRVPTFLYDATFPWLGALPNIVGDTALTLKNSGNPIDLGSRTTYVPTGTSTATSAVELAAGLLGNAGLWNLEFPDSSQSPTGLRRLLSPEPKNTALRVSLRRQMSPSFEMFADLSYTTDDTTAVYNPMTRLLSVPDTAPTNPFTTAVSVQVPDASQVPFNTASEMRSATLGALLRLPGEWVGVLDYTWSENLYRYDYFQLDSRALRNDLNNGTLNPFVDSLRHPLDFKPYLQANNFDGSNSVQSVSARGSGPLPSLPWGTPQLTVGVEYRIAHTPEHESAVENSITTSNNFYNFYYERNAKTQSIYLESSVPLVRAGAIRGLHALEFQLAGRLDRYDVDNGTDFKQTLPNLSPPLVVYSGPTRDNQPYFSSDSYSSHNYTAGFKYQPNSTLTLRVSSATAFVPPSPNLLLTSPVDPTSTTDENDPQNNNMPVSVNYRSGGNPDLKPENSRSLNAGLIWEPSWRPLSGLRANIEYYRIKQFDFAGSLSPQAIVSGEANFPGRVVRNEQGAITLVDISAMNLFYKDTEGMDLSLEYAFRTTFGEWRLAAVQSRIIHLKNQVSSDLPVLESAGYHPSEILAGAAQYKSNATLTWVRGQWTAGWSAQYFGSYKMFGVAGGPTSVEYGNGEDYLADWFILPQGSDTVPSQIYHDMFVGYTFSAGSAAGHASRGAGMLEGLRVQMGMRNVFNTVPPLDVYSGSDYAFLSTYGDLRLRSYWLTAGLSF